MGARQVIAQSFGGWTYAREGGAIKTEEDRLDPNPPPALRRTLDAICYLEREVLHHRSMAGVVLRYGAFYGPGTSIGRGGNYLDDIHSRRFPLVGRGTGIWSFIHIADAAQATLAAMEHGATGLYNVVDDDPAPVAEWLPYLAAVTGAGPPRHIPELLARLLIGEHAVILMNEIRGASNVKAKRDLLWQPHYPSWKQGFENGLG
ncbi:MAG: NAD-dependent epimerase/dehydratase family protein [Bryobacteraceae bacterium]